TPRAVTAPREIQDGGALSSGVDRGALGDRVRGDLDRSRYRRLVGQADGREIRFGRRAGVQPGPRARRAASKGGRGDPGPAGGGGGRQDASPEKARVRLEGA